MRKDEYDRWPDDVDLDRVRAAPGSVAGAWVAAAMVAALMLVVPSTVSTVDVALRDTTQKVARAGQQLAQLPWSTSTCRHSG
jgi:hypothetical protein